MSDNSDIGNTETEEETKAGGFSPPTVKESPILKPKPKRKMSENQMKNLEVGRQKRKEKR